jgi:predicted oxidoreductase
MTFGQEWGWGSTPEESKTILNHYLEQGGNFVNTANAYTKGHAETIIGDYFKDSPERRHRTVIATKCFGSMLTGDPNSGGAGRKAIVAACEESLRRLHTDYIDLYWMHCYDRYTPIEEYAITASAPLIIEATSTIRHARRAASGVAGRAPAPSNGLGCGTPSYTFTPPNVTPSAPAIAASGCPALGLS